MLTVEEMTALILQKDIEERDAAVDALSEADAKQMLKRMLSTVHRAQWKNSEK